MKEDYGDIWDLAEDFEAIVITTNGFIKDNGEVVMGRGIAKEAKERYPNLPKHLGDWVKANGNVPGITNIVPNITVYDVWRPYYLLTFPVKPAYSFNGAPGWMVNADIELIRESAKLLVDLVDKNDIKTVILPRPGCGNGRLKWGAVKPVIEPILDDRFTVVTWHP